MNAVQLLVSDAYRRMFNRVFTLAALVALACLALSFSCAHATDSVKPVRAPEVFEWNTFATELVANQLPPLQTHALAVAQIAIHDALNAIDARYEWYEYSGAAPGASVPAAVAAAAHDTLVRLLPEAASRVEARYVAKLASLPDGVAKDTGVLVGQAAAAAIFARRGAEDVVGAFGKPYTPGPARPGIYQPTPPVNAVFLAGWGDLAPFALQSTAQFRSRAPFAVGSPHYARDYTEVKDLGSAASTVRSIEQTETARFWFDAATKEWHQAARQGLAAVAADEWQAARTLALVSIAMADGVIASAETKFTFHYWRPITAIRAGEHDGNAATRGDPTWEPLCATPPFPEHNSTHAVTGAAAATVLALTIADQHDFTIDSPTLAGVSRTYARFSTAAAEEGRSRIFCGIHFRQGMLAGLAQGRRVARYVVTTVLRPLRRGGDDGHPPTRTWSENTSSWAPTEP